MSLVDTTTTTTFANGAMELMSVDGAGAYSLGGADVGHVGEMLVARLAAG